MDTKFEEHLTDLMNLRTEPRPGQTAPFSTADVLAGVRRRSRARAVGIGGSALAVIAIGAGAATVAASAGAGGPGSTVNAASGGARAVSPIKHLTNGAQRIVVGGVSFSPWDATAYGFPNDVLHSPSITGRVSRTPTEFIYIGSFHDGNQVPSLIDVVADDGKHYTATIVEADDNKNRFGFYAVVPAGTTPTTQPDVVKIYAYDAAGHLLGQPPQPK